jgi:hypothetical protein
MKNGAVGRNVVAEDGVCGPAVAVSGGWGVIGGDLWWLGGVCESWKVDGVKGECVGQVKVMGEKGGK